MTADATHPLPALPPAGTRVVLGLSGGVDSAVVAALLVDAGCEVVAVTTRNFCFGEAPFDTDDHARSCCSEEAVAASRELSAELGMQHVVLDVAAQFATDVIEDYVDEYRAGRTPSPCVRCNARVRFPRLSEFAREVGAVGVATGHYARRVGLAGEIFVARGVDAAKDQSYFLYRLGSERLSRTFMPLGDKSKAEVREIARLKGLPVAEAPESQELCFVPDGDRSRLLGEQAAAGDVVDIEGNVLGRHPGIEFFTVGQRKGLGLGGGPTRFVVDLDPRSRRVVVGDERDLMRDCLELTDLVVRDPMPGVGGLSARTRSRHAGVSVESFDADRGSVVLTESDRAPAVGQAVVLDRDGIVIGGGTLASALHRGTHRKNP